MNIQRLYSVAGARAFIGPLLDDHYEELCTDKSMVLAPDWDKYQALNDIQALLILTVFHGAKIVGYEVCFLQPHVHYKDTLLAWSDVLFVHKDYRNTSAGGRLMKAMATLCKEHGATKLLRHAKPGTALDLMLKHRAPPFEHVYAQSL